MLLHSPPVAEGWLAFLTAIRQRCELPGDVRELVIVQVAHLNGARYEAEQHVLRVPQRPVELGRVKVGRDGHGRRRPVLLPSDGERAAHEAGKTDQKSS